MSEVLLLIFSSYTGVFLSNLSDNFSCYAYFLIFLASLFHRYIIVNAIIM